MGLIVGSRERRPEMLKLLRCVMAFAVVLTATYASAGGTTVRGHVSRIIQKGPKTVITITGDFKSTPTACPYGDTLIIYSVDNRTEAGRSLVSAALAAGDKAVTVTGSGVCEPTWLYRDARSEGLLELY